MGEVADQVKTKNLKWTHRMEIALVNQVITTGAHLKGGEENVETKFKSITTYLWKTPEFNNQLQVSGASVNKKFKALLKSFRDTHGLSDNSEKVNISALPEESNDLDLLMETIYNDMEEKKRADFKKKAKEDEKKRSISDKTHAVCAGGGRKRLAEMSAEKLSSSSNLQTVF
jgi:hypothetical protein